MLQQKGGKDLGDKHRYFDLYKKETVGACITILKYDNKGLKTVTLSKLRVYNNIKYLNLNEM